MLTIERQGRPLPITAAPAAKYLRADFPELEAVARVTGGAMLGSGREDFFATVGDGTTKVLPLFADAEFLEIFALPFIQGDRDALRDSNSIVLKEELAQRLFGTRAVVGRQLQLNGRSLQVTGVIRDIPQPSHLSDSALSLLRFEALVSMDVYEHSLLVVWGRDPAEERWNSYNYFTYALLPRDGSLDVKGLDSRLNGFAERHVPSGLFRQRIGARPVSEATTMLGDVSGASTITVLIALGGLVLIVACLNFANLATAQAAHRGLEVGVRKAMGATRGSVARQYAVEAAVLVTSALAIALSGVAIAASIAKHTLDMNLGAVLLTSPRFWASVLLVAAVVGGIASAYPALVLSRQRPVRAMQSVLGSRASAWPAKLLVGIQFGVTSLLLILTLVMIVQNAQLHENIRGAADPVVVVTTNIKAAGISLETLRTELERSGKVTSVSAVRYQPWTAPFDAPSVARSEGASAQSFAARRNAVAHDFFATFDMQLLAGRVFAQTDHDEIGSVDSVSQQRVLGRYVVIDRALAEQLQFSSPQEAVASTLYAPSPDASAPAEQATIIGVVENKPLQMLGFDMKASMYVLAPGRTGFPVIRIRREDVRAGLEAIDAAWRRLAPNVPIQRVFADELFEQSYRSVSSVSRVFGAIAVFAFAIATTGLIGMAVHVVGARRREIGIRKSLGASEGRVLSLLLWDFSKPVVIANLLTWPIAFVVALAYSSFFMVRAPVSPLPFALGLCITVAIAWGAVGLQAWRAARMKPAAVLRYE